MNLLSAFIRQSWEDYNIWGTISQDLRVDLNDKNVEITVAVTRPSSHGWSEDSRLHRAVEEALSHGPTIKDVFLTDESYAGLAALSQEEEVKEKLKIGTRVAVFDIGAGTVDSSVHQVVHHDAENLETHELSPPRGNTEGVKVIVSDFASLLDTYFSNFHNSEDMAWENVKQDLLTSFEEQIKSYEGPGSDNSNAGVRIQSYSAKWSLTEQAKAFLAEAGFVVNSREIYLTHKVLTPLFRKRAGMIAQLIQGHIRDAFKNLKASQVNCGEAAQPSAPDWIFGFGGGAQNPYTRILLKEFLPADLRGLLWFPQQLDRSIVARGGAIFAANRCHVKSFNIQCGLALKQAFTWNPGYFKRDPKEFWKYSSTEFNKNEQVSGDTARWLCQADDNLDADVTFAVRGTRTLTPVNGKPIKLQEVLFASEIRQEADEGILELNGEEIRVSSFKKASNAMKILADLKATIDEPSDWPFFRERNIREKFIEVDSETTVRIRGSKLQFQLGIPGAGHYLDNCPKGCKGRKLHNMAKCEAILGHAPFVASMEVDIGDVLGVRRGFKRARYNTINSSDRGDREPPVENQIKVPESLTAPMSDDLSHGADWNGDIDALGSEQPYPARPRPPRPHPALPPSQAPKKRKNPKIQDARPRKGRARPIDKKKKKKKKKGMITEYEDHAEMET